MRKADLAGMLLGQFFEEKRLHENCVVAHSCHAVGSWWWHADGECVGRVVAFHATREDGDHVGRCGCRSQEGREVLDEAHAGVVKEGHLGVETFFGGYDALVSIRRA